MSPKEVQVRVIHSFSSLHRKTSSMTCLFHLMPKYSSKMGTQRALDLFFPPSRHPSLPLLPPQSPSSPSPLMSLPPGRRLRCTCRSCSITVWRIHHCQDRA
jgi:hypothetical protein